MSRLLQRILRASLPLAIAACSLPLAAQDIAEKPDLRVGDEWVFHVTGTKGGNPIDGRWRRRIVESLPGEKFRVQPKLNDVDVFDTSWNPRHAERPTFWPLDFKFPWGVGTEWSFASPAGLLTTTGRPFEQRGHHKVVALESIRVPAGTFRCFRIEGESSFISGDPYSPDWKQVDRWVMTRWYCPEIQYMAKMHAERYSAAWGVGKHDVEDSELLSYKRSAQSAPMPGPQSAPASPNAPPPTNRFDGTWSVSLACEAAEGVPALIKQFRIAVLGGEFVVHSGRPGAPGYSHVTGRPTDDGILTLDGEGISALAQYFGQSYEAHFEGRQEGDRFALVGYYGVLPCTMTMLRVKGS